MDVREFYKKRRAISLKEANNLNIGDLVMCINPIGQQQETSWPQTKPRVEFGVIIELDSAGSEETILGEFYFRIITPLKKSGYWYFPENVVKVE